MAEYVFGDTPPPPVLSRAFNYRGWGCNLFDLRADELHPINTAWNTYQVLNAYRRSAPNSAAWANKNPREYRMVSDILHRMKTGWNNGTQ